MRPRQRGDGRAVTWVKGDLFVVFPSGISRPSVGLDCLISFPTSSSLRRLRVRLPFALAQDP
eukprot:scaffold218066_cov35-Tisochrysis_lutea.AAC.2